MGTSSAMSTSNQYVKYEISISRNWQSTNDNCTSVNVNVNFWRTNTGHSTYGTGTVYCKIDGTTYSASISPSQKITNSGITLFSKSLLIYHNNDGTKTLNVSAWININNVLTSNEQSYSEVLPTIPRQAQILNVGDFTVENEHWLTYQKYSDNFTYNLEIDVKAPGESDNDYWFVCTIQNYVSGTHIQFNYNELDIIYRKLGRNITTNSYADVKYILKTYNNGAFIGQDSREVRGNVTKPIARITTLGDFTVEEEHWLTYKTYSDNFSYGLWIVAKNVSADISGYVSIAGYNNYESGYHLQFNQNQIRTIYNLVAPEIMLDTYVDVMYHLQTYDQNGNFLGEETKVVKGKITRATASINSVNDTAVENKHSLTYTSFSRYFWYRLIISARKYGTTNTWENVGTFDGYTSGNNINLSDDNITKIYKLALPDTNVGAYIDLKYELQTLSGQNGYIMQTSTVEKAQIINGSMYINVNGTWKNSVPFIKVNDVWKPCLAYINANRVWKKGETQ